MNAQTGDLKEGDEAPSFCLQDKDNRETCLTDFKGKWIVIYFYPKDNTSGCTREAVDFTGAINEFESGIQSFLAGVPILRNVISSSLRSTTLKSLKFHLVSF